MRVFSPRPSLGRFMAEIGSNTVDVFRWFTGGYRTFRDSYKSFLRPDAPAKRWPGRQRSPPRIVGWRQGEASVRGGRSGGLGAPHLPMPERSGNTGGTRTGGPVLQRRVAHRGGSDKVDATSNSTGPGSAAPATTKGPKHAVRFRPQESRRHPDGRGKGAQTGGPADQDLSRHHDGGRLRDLDRGRPAQDRGRRQADRPQGRAHLEGDAAVLADRRAGLRPSARRHDDRRRRQDPAREFLPAAGRDRARLHHGQARSRVRASVCPTCCAPPNTSCRRSRSSTRACRTRARFSIPCPTMARRPASSSAAARSGRWMSICAGSAASCTRIPRSRRPASPPACSAIRRSAWPGSPTSSGQHGVALEPGHIVLAGSFTRVVFAKKGDTLHADFGALGGIAVQFV